jgi:hypothetical protein
MNSKIVSADDILIALGYFLSLEEIDHFDVSIKKLHGWFYKHRAELPCQLSFHGRDFDPESAELRQAIEILKMSNIIYQRSNDNNPHRFFFNSVASKCYLHDKPRLIEGGLFEEKLVRLTKSFIKSCCG